MNKDVLLWVQTQRVRARWQWRTWLKDLAGNKAVQAAVMTGSMLVLLIAGFATLFHLCSAAVAALAILLILEKVIGLRITPPPGAFGF